MIQDNAVSALIDFWKEFELNPPRAGSRVHPKDDSSLSEECRLPPPKSSLPGTGTEQFFERRVLKDREAYKADPFEEDTRFDLSLEPVPFLGNLETAKIFLLMLNPKLGYADYSTNESPKFREALLKNGRQEFLTNGGAPCLALDPAYGWSSWFAYYERLLRSTLVTYALKEENKDYGKALRKLSSQLAIIELVPYYSENASKLRKKLLDSIPSVRLARKAARELVDRAGKGEVLVVVMWGADKWKLKPDPDNNVHCNSKARNGFNEECRKALVKWLRESKND